MSEVAIIAAGVVVFAITTVTTLLFGYSRMSAASRRAMASTPARRASDRITLKSDASPPRPA